MKQIESFVNAFHAAQVESSKFSDTEDKGSCNLDTVIVNFSGWRQLDIKRLESMSGFNIGEKMTGIYKGYRFVFFEVPGQAYRRTIMVEAAKKKLQELDIDCSVWYQMD